MGNSQVCDDVETPLRRRIERLREIAQTYVEDIVEGLREEEIRDIPSRREGREISDSSREGIVPDSGDDEISFSSIASVFSRRLSRGGFSTTPKEPLLVYFHYESLDDALRKSRKYKMPVFSVGSSTRTESGETLNTSCRHVLAHPLLAEAAEALFITVAPQEIDNENFLCVQILDGSGKDISDSKPLELWSIAGMALAMARSLKAYKRRVPVYLKLLVELEMGRIRVGRGGHIYTVEKVTEFGVEDISAAEVEFAGLDGVLGTLAGHIEGRKTIQVSYNSSKLSVSKLVRFALDHNLAKVVFYRSTDYRIPAQLEINRAHSAVVELMELPCAMAEDKSLAKHALRQTLLRFIPMTELQSIRANRFVAMDKNDLAVEATIPSEVEEMLSPRQAMLLRRVTHSTRREVFADVIDVPIRDAWQQLPQWVVEQLRGTSFRKRRSMSLTLTSV